MKLSEKTESLKIPEWLDIGISKEVLSDFFSRAGTDLLIEDRNEFFEKLKTKISQVTPYSPILDRLQKNSKKLIDFSNIKDEEIVNYAGPVVTFGIDLKGSSRLVNSKDVLEKFFGLINFFEKLYEKENLAVFSQVEGDKIYIGFFSDNLKRNTEIFKLFYYLVQSFTNQQYHLEGFIWEKRKGEVSMSVFKDVIIHTISSENLNVVMKEMKKYTSANHTISTELLKVLTENNLEGINLWSKYLGIDLLDINVLEDILNNLNKIDWKNDKFIFSLILTYIVNNSIEGWMPKVETIKQGTKIINYGEENTDVYLILEGNVRLHLKGNSFFKKVVPAKTIIGEMSVKNRLADADVWADSDLKVVKIPKKIFKGFNEKTLNPVLASRFQELMERYIFARSSENIKLDKILKEIINKIGENQFEELMKILIDFPGKWEDVKNKIILKEKQINSNIYVIKAGSKVKIEKNGVTKTIILASDGVFGEISYINSKKLGKAPESTATVEIIEGSYKKIDFNSYSEYLKNNSKSSLVMGLLKKILGKGEKISMEDLEDVLLILSNARTETSIFVNFAVNSSDRKVA